LASDALPILQAVSLVTGYGSKRVLNDIAVEIFSSEIVALLGRNGAGKSTFLKAIFGLLPVWSGVVHVDDQQYTKLTPRILIEKGIVYVPQGHRVFDDLSVYENLDIVAKSRRCADSIGVVVDRFVRLFPQVGERLRVRAGSLSGGERQMLALAIAFVAPTRLLLLDEPCMGLAPKVGRDLLQRIGRLCKEQQTAALIVEQKAREVLAISQRAYIFDQGKVSWTGGSDQLSSDSALAGVLFGEVLSGGTGELQKHFDRS
jgi:branched-chain amino acid transport system ATP-binding protein